MRKIIVSIVNGQTPYISHIPRILRALLALITPTFNGVIFGLLV